MKPYLIGVTLALQVLANIETIDSSVESSLKLVQIIQRHGDRTPTNFYATDPLKDPKKWPEGIGELTSSGKRRAYEFGLSLRHRYDTYLGDSPRDVTAKSSSSARCLESVQSFLTGLYKPDGFWIWDNTSAVAKNWQPIAVGSDDKLLRTSASCPKTDRLWRQFMATEEVTKYINENKPFMVGLSEKTGDNYVDVKPSPLRPLEFLSTTLRVEKECGHDLPEWANTETRDKLKDLENHAFYFDWKDPQIQRLRAGPLIEELVQNMLNRADELTNQTTAKPMKRLYVYGTHDVNQVVLMQALGVYTSAKVGKTPPTYTGSLVFELHQSGDHFVVKLLYFNNVTVSATAYTPAVQDFVELDLMNCNPKSDCTLEEFIKSVGNHIPEDWEQECENIVVMADNEYKYFNTFSLVYILIGVILTAIAMALFRCIRRRYTSHSMRSERNSLQTSHLKKYSL